MVQQASTLNIAADVSKNRLIIEIGGDLCKKDYAKLQAEVKSCIAELRSGFIVITDLRDCHMSHLSGLANLQKIMSLLISHGVGEILRLVDQESLIFKQAQNVTTKIQGYKPVYVSSQDEAEAFLARVQPRNGLRIYLHQHEITYVVDGQEYKGRIVNISTSGCAIESERREELMGRETLLRLTFAPDNQALTLFEIPAHVVRVEESLFAVRFLNFPPPEKERLWGCLCYEAAQLL